MTSTYPCETCKTPDVPCLENRCGCICPACNKKGGRCGKCGGAGFDASCSVCRGSGCFVCAGTKTVTVENLLDQLSELGVTRPKRVDLIAAQLGTIGDPRAIEPLVAILRGRIRSGRPLYAHDLIEALGKLNSTECSEEFVPLFLRESDDQSRRTAVHALGRMPSPAGLMALHHKRFSRKSQGFFEDERAAFHSNLSRLTDPRALGQPQWTDLATGLVDVFADGKRRLDKAERLTAQDLICVLRAGVTCLSSEVLNRIAILKDTDCTVDKGGGWGLETIDLGEARRLAVNELGQRTR